MTTMGGMLGVGTRIGIARLLTAFRFSLVIELFFGLYPANTASKLNPIEALHDE